MALPGTGSTVTSRSNLEGHKDGRQHESKPLQEWIESISLRMMSRIDAVGDEVQKVVNECRAVELDLKNTFNSFRCLSSTQFIENRVYEEDETESVGAETPAKESQHAFGPTESYEDEILPRYRDAVSTAWAAFQEINYQHDQASRRLRSRNKVLRNLDYDGRLHLVPHVIGTDEFARDLHCGLADLRHKRSVVDGIEVDSDTERDGADLAAELVGAGSVSEGEWSEAESDVGDQGGGFEPAVSAALDFKAMLEAALRNPSLPYDGSSSTQAIDKYGEVNNDYFLSNVAIDNYYGSPRTISRPVESGDRRAGDTSANTDASDSGGSWQLPGNRIPGEDEQPLKATLEELLKKPFMLKTQNSTEEDSHSGSGSNVQLDYSGLANLPFIPGGLFDDDEDDRVLINSNLVTVRDSNTEPTVPEGLFQRKPSLGATEHSNAESRSSSSVDLEQSRSPARVPSYTTARQSPKLDVNTLFKSSESRGSMKLEISDPSFSLGNAENVSIRSETPNGSKGEVTSKTAFPTKARGGLFDDSDDDEDAGDLFGKSLSIKVTDYGITSQPVLQTWTSVSSKGLFDDLEDEADAQEILAPQPSGSGSEGHKSDELSLLLRQVSMSGRDDVYVPQGQSSRIVAFGSTSESFQKQISSPNLYGNSFDRSQKKSFSSSLSASTPTTIEKLSSSSSLSESSPNPLQKQSPSYKLSKGTLSRTQKYSSDSYLSASSSDGPKKQLFGNFVDSTQKQTSGFSLAGDVPENASTDSNPIKMNGKEDGSKEKTNEPHVNLESLLASGIRPTVRTVVYSSDDSDSWSKSGSDVDENSSSPGKADSPNSLKGIEISTEDLESNHEEDDVGKIDENQSPAQATIRNKETVPVEGPSKVLVPEDMRKHFSGFFGSQEVSSSSSPPRGERSSLDTENTEILEEQTSVKSLSSILEPIRPRLPSVDQREQSGARTSSNPDGAKLIHTTLSRPLGPSKRRAPSPIHTLQSARLPVQAAPQQSQPPPRNLSTNVILSSDLSTPEIDSGGLTTFTSLFDEDDEANGLLLQRVGHLTTPFRPEERKPRSLILLHRSSDLFTSRGRHEAKSISPLDLNLDVDRRGRDGVKETHFPEKTRSPIPARISTASPAKTSDLKVIDGEPGSGRSTSKLSSLLFGDDYEDSEDALFWPLRVKSPRRSSYWLVST